MNVNRALRQLRFLLYGVVLSGSLLGASLVDAATYYVATSGNDTNPGTQTRPFRTIKRGAKALKAGDTLRVKSGTYAESLTNPFPSGLSSSQPTTIEGDPAPNRPVLRPSSGNYVLAMFETRAHVRVRHLVFDSGSLTGNGSVIHLKGATTPTVWFEHFEAIGNKRMYEYGTNIVPNSAVFRHCSVHGAGPKQGPGTGVGVHGFYHGGAGGLIEHCKIYDNDGYGIQYYSGSCTNCVNKNVFRNNYVHHNRNGIYMARGYDNQVYNNIIAHHPGRGVWFTVNRNYLYNNTIFNNKGSGIDISGGSGAVRNNIVYQNTRNIHHTGGSPTLSHNLLADPKFVSATSGNFRLQASSPAINKGITLTEVRTDFAGTSRPQGGAYDIGAYEYTSSTTSTSVSTPTNLRLLSGN